MSQPQVDARLGSEVYLPILDAVVPVLEKYTDVTHGREVDPLAQGFLEGRDQGEPL